MAGQQAIPSSGPNMAQWRTADVDTMWKTWAFSGGTTLGVKLGPAQPGPHTDGCGSAAS